MKKFLFCAAAAALLTGMSACTNDEPVAVENDGNVTFSVNLPAGIESRSYSDGLTATKLHYYVYDEDNGSANIEALNGEADFDTNRTAKVSLNLASGKSYSIVFWADAPGNSYYTYTASSKELKVNYSGNAQDENRDAFYVYEPTFKVTGAISKDIILRRPFAQINVGTTDWASATAAGISLTETSMTVTGVANKINLGTGDVEGNDEVTFTSAAMPATPGETFPYAAANVDRYMAMNYVLVGKDKSTVDVKMNTNANPAIDEMVFSQVPVQRNYRTNIYGALLTNPADYKVIINQNYEDSDYNVNGNPIPAGKIRIGEALYDTLAEALAAVNDNDVVEISAGNYDGKITWPSNKTFTVKGQGKDATTISNLSNNIAIAGGTATFENLTLQVEVNPYVSTCFGFIHTKSVTYNNVRLRGEMWLYASETETFNNCVFDYFADSDQNHNGRYAIWVYGSRNAVFNNCVFNNEFNGKAILVYGVEDFYNRNVTVNKCTFNCTGTAKDNGAVEIHTELFANTAGVITINNSTCSDKYEFGLWHELNNTSGETTTKFKVIVDGVTVQEGQEGL